MKFYRKISYVFFIAIFLAPELKLKLSAKDDISALGAKTDSIWIEPFTSMEFVLIPAGKFLMGIPDAEKIRDEDAPLHPVRISKDFFIGKYEVTQGQWLAIMNENPSKFQDCGLDCPVENVNWFEVQEFIKRLNQTVAETTSAEIKFRLPAEAEWEYACRAGTETPFSTGQNLTTGQANYDGNYPYPNFPAGIYRDSPVKVGSFPPNPWGVYDMHGNVWEWCQDWYCPYPANEVVDPVGNCDSGKRVIRGGSWYFNAESARSGRRYTHSPEDRGPSLGFRLVRENP